MELCDGVPGLLVHGSHRFLDALSFKLADPPNQQLFFGAEVSIKV
jgi:hypothetical protein